MAKAAVALLVLAGLSVPGEAKPHADVFHNQCGVSHIKHWPENLRDDELEWEANEDDPASSTGPLYRMFTEKEMRTVEAGQDYRIDLTAVVPEAYMKRFLIYAESNSEECGFGRLRSLSEESEHLSYSCPRFLVERSSDFLDGFSSVPFSWEAPKCGCTQISVQILNERNEIFTIEDDPYLGLSVLSCVREEEEEETEEVGKKAVIQVEEEEEGDVAEIDDDLFDDVHDYDYLMMADQPSVDRPANQDSDPAQQQQKPQQLLFRGKKQCCKRGAQVSGRQDVDCEAAPMKMLDRIWSKSGLEPEKCALIYQMCCEGPETLDEFKKNRLMRRKEQRRKRRLQRRKKQQLETVVNNEKQ